MKSQKRNLPKILTRTRHIFSQCLCAPINVATTCGMLSSRMIKSVSDVLNICLSVTLTLDAVQLIYPMTSSFQPLPNACCCDNCTPRLFPVEHIVVTKTPGLKRGKKKCIPEKQEKAIHDQLNDWREEELVEMAYPGVVSISGATVLGDDVVEKIAMCSECINTYSELRRHV